MGGNATAVIKHTGVETRAQKIDLREIGRQEFLQIFVKIFRTMNAEFEALNSSPLWANPQIIKNGYVFNGSTSFVMNPNFTDEEILKVKPLIGDVDITVPEEHKEDLWKYLDSKEGEEIIPGVRYMGSNKPTISSIGEQINSIFVVDFPTGKVNIQVDFEFMPFENKEPNQWAKFSHSSSYLDAMAGIKAVHHKFLIRALVGAKSTRDDIIICTQKSTAEKVRFKKMKTPPRILKFSVVRGIRIAYEPLLNENNEIIVQDGKLVFRELPSKTAEYQTKIKDICGLAFNLPKVQDEDVKDFESFVGVISLIKKHLSQEQIQSTHIRYKELLWGSSNDRGQELEVNNKALDFQVKNNGYLRFISEFRIKNEAKHMIDEYYSKYGQRGKGRN